MEEVRSASIQKKRMSIISTPYYGEDNTTNLIPCVAQWLNLPQVIIKTLQLLVGIAVVVTVLAWHSEDVTIFNFDITNEFSSSRNFLICYVGIACVTMVYCITLISVGVIGINIPPAMHVLITGSCLGIWLISSGFVSAIIDNFDNSIFATSRNVDTLYLKVATAFGFFEVLFFLFDIFLGFLALSAQNKDDEEEEAKPTSLRRDSTISSQYNKHVTGRGSYRRSIKKS